MYERFSGFPNFFAIEVKKRFELLYRGFADLDFTNQTLDLLN
jgi:hypothetical protein